MDLEYQYLVGRLQEALAMDDSVNALDIKVVVSGGKIHLTGEVPTPERRRAVDEVVHRIMPGMPVRNDLTILQLFGGGEPEAIDD